MVRLECKKDTKPMVLPLEKGMNHQILQKMYHMKQTTDLNNACEIVASFCAIYSNNSCFPNQHKSMLNNGYNERV